MSQTELNESHCNSCGQKKDVSEFYKKSSGEGVRSTCKQCYKQKRKAHYAENREAALNYQHQYYFNNQKARQRYQVEYERKKRKAIAKNG